MLFFFGEPLLSTGIILKIGGLHQKLSYCTSLSALKCLHFKNKLLQPSDVMKSSHHIVAVTLLHASFTFRSTAELFTPLSCQMRRGLFLASL